jgi:EAL and modified HD-GYP domain-containing signal transduction protein
MAEVPRLSEQLQIGPDMLNRAHVSALAWVEELGV